MFGVWYQLLSGCEIALPSASVSNGTDVSIRPMSSTRNTIMFGLSCAMACPQKQPETAVNMILLPIVLICICVFVFSKVQILIVASILLDARLINFKVLWQQSFISAAIAVM